MKMELLLLQEIGANKMIEHDEKLKMCLAMEKFGSGFVEALAECFIRADSNNLERLCNAFPEIVEMYIKIANERMS